MNLTSTLLLTAILVSTASAQSDSTLFKRVPADTAQQGMNMDAVYNRPFLQMGGLPVSIGGYVEADYRYMGSNGVSDGHSFGMPRMTLFVAASIHRYIRFLTEVEFEEGGKEIAIEFASVDVSFAPLLNFRGGIVMNPIGAFNQNHDGPKWEFVDRPVAMTQMLPATWSNVGFGMYGKHFDGAWALGYEAYLTNGFDNSIITNSQNRTFLPASKANAERFTESSNGRMLVTGKVAIRNQRVGEIGLSYMGGIYNKVDADGLQLDHARRLDVFAIDANTTLPGIGTRIVGEWAWIMVDVPETYTQQYGNRQHGGFVDVIQPVIEGTILGFDKAVVNFACRIEYVDWNVGRFRETGGNIADDLWAIVPAISIRPARQTVLRINYRNAWQRDILGNPAVRTSGIEAGISTYF